jgi:hypothetical protein
MNDQVVLAQEYTKKKQIKIWKSDSCISIEISGTRNKKTSWSCIFLEESTTSMENLPLEHFI